MITELITFSRPLTLRRHLYDISRGQRKKIRLFDWLGSQLHERDTNFTGNGGGCSPAVISAPIDLDGRPNSFSRSGNSFKKYCPEFPKNWMHTGSYDHMISVSVELYHG